MKFTFLGTAAAEGFPAVFCNCECCNEARKSGGVNVRSRSQSIINDDFLLDLPADTYMHFLNNGILGHKIKYLFVTHSHEDHFYVDELQMRHGAFAHDMDVPVLNVYCSSGSYEKFHKQFESLENIKVTLIKPYERIIAGEYEVIQLPARHFEGDGAVFYIIKYQGKTLLYAHDTGYFYDEVFNYLEKEKPYFDFISLDCTSVSLDFGDDSTHMGFYQIERVISRMKQYGCVDNKTQMYVNHFSHNGNCLQEYVEKCAKPFGLKVAYDGLKVEI